MSGEEIELTPEELKAALDERNDRIKEAARRRFFRDMIASIDSDRAHLQAIDALEEELPQILERLTTLHGQAILNENRTTQEKIDNRLQQTWKMMSTVETDDEVFIDPIRYLEETDGEYEDRQLGLAHQSSARSSLLKLYAVLKKSLNSEEMLTACDEIGLLARSMCDLGKSSHTPGFKLDKAQRMERVREQGATKKKRNRRDQISPLVVQFSGIFANASREGLAQFKKTLADHPDFRNSLPKNYPKDPRTLMGDIRAILFPDPDPEFPFILETVARDGSVTSSFRVNSAGDLVEMINRDFDRISGWGPNVAGKAGM